MARFHLLGVMCLGASVATGSVSAASVALSLNEITNFSMSSAGVTFSGFTFSNDTAATEDGGTGGADTDDAPAACIGDCAGWENEFFAHTPSITEFSYGDAQILSDDVLNANGAASSIGEVVVNNGIAHASGSNVLTSIALNVDDSAPVLSFSFYADALMQTSVSGTGLSSAANMFFNISLTNGTGEVFSWTPDGVDDDINGVKGSIGGTENDDPFNLNYGIIGNTTFDPVAALFSAETNSLPSGSYTLNIKMENQVNGAAVVPVPAAVWLFGSGLLGLIGVARKKAA